jgi:hypothetical protein
MPVALMMWQRLRAARRLTRPWMDLANIFLIFMAMLIVALVGAGVFYVSEAMVQASLYRFSIYPKLITCIAAGFFIYEIGAMTHRPRAAVSASLALGLLTLALCIARGPYLGMFHIPEDEAKYLAACDWVRQHTPVDAVFIVPPQEQEFRLRAQRAIVVNYKGVPQLSTELPEWRDRLEAVLDLSDLRTLPRPFPATLAAMRDRYAALSPDALERAAQHYGARYIVSDRRWDERRWEGRRVDIDGNDQWFLYDLSR